MAYNKNTDYQKLINDAVSKGDYSSAAKYEQQRNEKIKDLDATGTNKYGATATNNYSSYLGSGSSSSGGSSSGGASLSRNPSYIPLDTSGNDYASMVGMSDIEKAALEAASNSWYEAKARGDQAAMDAAHAQAQAIRQKYGYSGGADGSQYLIQNLAPMVPEFQFQEAPSYSSKYQSYIDDSLKDYLNRDAFVYNPETDPLYKSYQDTYTRAGGRAMEDALGIIAAQTGGLASSYAGTAAQQTYNNYMQELADKIPELQQLAYSMYLNDGAADADKLNLLMGLENQNYNQYLNQLGQYNTDRSFAYNQLRDYASDLRYNNEWNYGVGRDEAADELDQRQWDYNVSQDQQAQKNAENEMAVENAWKKLQSGVVPTDEELALLGMSRAEAQQMAQFMKLILMGYYG